MHFAPGQKPDATPLDPISLMLDASGVVLVVLLILMVAATAVWLIGGASPPEPLPTTK